MPFLMQPAPRTPFNAPLSGERQFAWAQFSFAEVRAVRATLGGTVNDLVLAVLAGGLGRYLERHDYATNGIELRAMCPVSMRKPEEHGALGNLVSMMFAPLYVGVKDPVERLNAERAAMERLKTGGQAAGLYALTELSRNVPPTWQSFVSQFDVPNTLLNMVSTNVPGPQIPLYLAGHKLLDWYPLGPLTSNVGLFVAILSYNQVLTMGATVDPKLVPDIWTFVECLNASFAELREAAARVTSAAAERSEATPEPNGKRRRTKQPARA
jgi:WS/DGAT/MGAT family acyltransferase